MKITATILFAFIILSANNFAQKDTVLLRTKGYSNITEFCMTGLTDGTDYSELNVALQTINGYKFNPYFNLGLGTGFEGYATFTSEHIVYPMFLLFGDLRICFTKKKFTPFLSFSQGYAFRLSNDSLDEYASGILTNFTFGIKKRLLSKREFHFGIGYRIQESYHNRKDYTGFSMKTGYTF